MSLIGPVSVGSPLCPRRDGKYQLPRVEIERSVLGNVVQEAVVFHRSTSSQGPCTLLDRFFLAWYCFHQEKERFYFCSLAYVECGDGAD